MNNILETEKWVKSMNEKWDKPKPLRENGRIHTYKYSYKANQNPSD